MKKFIDDLIYRFYQKPYDDLAEKYKDDPDEHQRALAYIHMRIL